MCVSRIPCYIRSFGALAYTDFYRKRIETRIAEIQDSSEKKKVEVWNFQTNRQSPWDWRRVVRIAQMLTNIKRSLHSSHNYNSSKPVLRLLEGQPKPPVESVLRLRVELWYKPVRYAPTRDLPPPYRPVPIKNENRYPNDERV